ncbi:hypothetical protein DK843_07320 [Chromobacterium phragmitis]|uniref:Nudix hydrolase domain-containing protein n=1 Tax=Chromobacterium phragmitis TaxID=2202141 RepID=A0A344UFT0_9NEIS|nr:hypothetical protein DK843_07320 [Chromobacterium phragmitis]
MVQFDRDRRQENRRPTPRLAPQAQGRARRVRREGPSGPIRVANMGDRRLAVARFVFGGRQLEELGQLSTGSLQEPAEPRKLRASIVIIEDGKLLLMHRVKPGKDYYALPGGNIKKSETAAIACVRETREETGLNVWLEEGPLCVLESEKRTEHVFVAREHRGMLRLGGPELAKLAPDNHYELVWLDAAALTRVKLRPKALLPHCLALLDAAERSRA